MKPTVGRIVHYVLAEGRSKGQVRSAEIVAVNTETCVNLHVKLDGSNDAGASGDPNALIIWKTSVLQGSADQPGSWFWPPRV